MDTNNKFQWKRVGMLFRLYYPMIRWQIVGYVILSIAVTGIMAFGQWMGHVMFPATVGSLMLSIAYYIAPIGFTRRDYRQVCDILPVTAGEKMAFLLLYFGLGTILLLSGPFYLLHFIFPDYVPCYLSAYNANVGIEIPVWGYLSGFVSALSVVAVTLWTLVVSKTSRGAMIFAAVVAVNVVMSVIGGIAGIVFAITHFDELKNNPEDILFVGGLVNYIIAIGIFISVTIISVFLTMLYRKLKCRGF